MKLGLERGVRWDGERGEVLAETRGQNSLLFLYSDPSLKEFSLHNFDYVTFSMVLNSLVINLFSIDMVISWCLASRYV